MVPTGWSTLFESELTSPVEPLFYSDRVKLIAGVDEVGRGALAGPVVTAAVILDPQHPIDGIRDSKKLSPVQRERLSENICRNALDVSIHEISHQDVDRYNVLEATRISMTHAVRNLKRLPDLVLTDAMVLNELDIPVKSLIRGDELSVNIGAASIVAKVYRDRWMTRVAVAYPLYGFEKHKGYGTRQHFQAIERHGRCPIHRVTFKISG